MRGCTTTVWWHGGCLLFTVPFSPHFPFSPSFSVPSCPSSSLRPFTLSSHRHSIRSILLLLLVGVAFYLMATGLFKQTIDCLQQVLEKPQQWHKHGLNWVREINKGKEKHCPNRKDTNTLPAHLLWSWSSSSSDFGVSAASIRSPSMRNRSEVMATPFRCAYALKTLDILIFLLTLKKISSPPWSLTLHTGRTGRRKGGTQVRKKQDQKTKTRRTRNLVARIWPN